jgi:transcriptional regulator with XRE-family HTH domain
MNDFRSKESAAVDVDKSDFSAAEKSRGNVFDNEGTLREAESSEETLRRVLGSYDLGHKLRQLRLRKKIALVDLGKHTGLSASMLSQLENGKLIPTLPTLARIAMVFDVGLEFFFSDKRSKRVFSIIRADDRMRFPELPDSPVPGYYFEVLAFGAMERALSAYLAEFPNSAPHGARPHFHEGAEFLHVVSGSLSIKYESEEHLLETGDSVYFDASEPHSYHGISDPPAKAIVITTPPRL